MRSPPKSSVAFEIVLSCAIAIDYATNIEKVV